MAYGPGGAYGVTQHSTLQGLSADDHPQYQRRAEAAVAVVVSASGGAYAARDRSGALLASATGDATAVLQAAVDALAGTGGRVELKAGTYSLTSALAFPGNNGGARIVLAGEGMGLTRLVQTAPGASAIAVGPTCYLDLRDLTIEMPTSGAGDAIAGGVADQNGWLYSEIANVEVHYGSAGTWALNLVNPFHLQLRNVRFYHVHNGLRFHQNHSGNNTGNCEVSDLKMTVEDVGTAVELSATSGVMNLNTFTGLRVWFYTTSAGSRGIYLGPNTRYNGFTDFNLENVDVGIDVADISNRFCGNLVRATGASSAAVRCRSTARNNLFADLAINGITGEANGVGVLDENTGKAGNTFVNCRVGSVAYATALSFSNTSARVNVYDIQADDSGSRLPVLSADTLTVRNRGAGSNPTFSANASADILDLSGTLRLTNVYNAGDEANVIGLRNGRYAAAYIQSLRVLKAGAVNASSETPIYQLGTGGLQAGPGGTTALSMSLQRATGTAGEYWRPSHDIQFQTGFGPIVRANGKYYRLGVDASGNVVATDLGATLP
ncbi:MAG TPA: hypothetical protein VNX21_02210 [Candidatus Thermoplasmatota archaeon]|nr:hypothetical protein [Candidatus Thermoplasmatota archaeon]